MMVQQGVLEAPGYPFPPRRTPFPNIHAKRCMLRYGTSGPHLRSPFPLRLKVNAVGSADQEPRLNDHRIAYESPLPLLSPDRRTYIRTHSTPIIISVDRSSPSTHGSIHSLYPTMFSNPPAFFINLLSSPTVRWSGFSFRSRAIASISSPCLPTRRLRYPASPSDRNLGIPRLP